MYIIYRHVVVLYCADFTLYMFNANESPSVCLSICLQEAVQVTLQSSDPHRTAVQIGLRLQNR